VPTFTFCNDSTWIHLDKSVTPLASYYLAFSDSFEDMLLPRLASAVEAMRFCKAAVSLHDFLFRQSRHGF
jgi:hypothetical protein